MKIVIKNVSKTATVVLHLACKWQVISSYLQKILGVDAEGIEPSGLSFGDSPGTTTAPICRPGHRAIRDRGVEKGKTGRFQPALLTVSAPAVVYPTRLELVCLLLKRHMTTEFSRIKLWLRT